MATCQTLAVVEVVVRRGPGGAEALQVLLQGLQLMSQTGPVRREESILFNYFTDPLEQLRYTNKGRFRHSNYTEEEKRVGRWMKNKETGEEIRAVSIYLSTVAPLPGVSELLLGTILKVKLRLKPVFSIAIQTGNRGET